MKSAVSLKTAKTIVLLIQNFFLRESFHILQVANGRLGSMMYNSTVAATGEQISSVADSFGAVGRKTVMLMVEPGMPATPVQINLPSYASNNTTAAAEADMLTDAAESLQALAGVVESAAAVEPVAAAEMLDQTDQDEGNSEASPDIETSKAENVTNEGSKEQSEVHLTSDQLVNLESGDYIEINGETYK